MTSHRNFRLALFGSLYFTQGAMMSYFLTFNSHIHTGLFHSVSFCPSPLLHAAS